MRLFLTAFIVLTTLSAFSQDKKSYTIVFLNKKSDAEKLTKEQSDKIMQGHMDNINKLAKEGKLLAAGPFEGGGGLFILNTTSIEEAKSWIAADPGVQAQRWNIELLPYQPRVGSICPVSEPYEMVHYSFVRFDAIVSKSTSSTYPEIIREHNDYLKTLVKTGNVITEGIFGDQEGGIVIMEGDVQPKIFDADPGVQQALLELQIKKLFIAKGSFCEK